MSATAPATLDRIRQHLVGLRMPRSLEVLEHLLRQLERGEISALEAIDALLCEELTLRGHRQVVVSRATELAGQGRRRRGAQAAAATPLISAHVSNARALAARYSTAVT